MLSHLREQLGELINTSLKEFFPAGVMPPDVDLEMPKDKNHGEFAVNVALKSARLLNRPPMDIAGELLPILQAAIDRSPLKTKIEKIEVQKPGFINFYISGNAVYDILYLVFQQKENYGRLDYGRNKKIQIEFVSANPTGPLSVAHARQAAVGDVLANILNFIGYQADREYYVNDEGNQINILGQSIMLRAKEILGQKIEFPENGYQGDYIRDMARDFLAKKHIKDISQIEKITTPQCSQFGVDYLMDVIKTELDEFGVTFDVWSYQSKLACAEKIQSVLMLLDDKGYLYEKDGALWFRSTDFGDDKDRVLRKSDGSYTYLAPDIAYHKNKYDRGYKEIYNIWGPDHHGYIPRLKASVQALGYDAKSLEVLIVQLATIYREGRPLSMSTRRGQYISLREVIDEVGTDAARFFFLMRNIKAHLDFDLELAKKQTPENPVYYIQYAHARIHSIVDKAKEENLSAKTTDISLLKEAQEIELIKKIGIFSDILVLCRQQMDVFSLVSYMMELAACFHRFYDTHRVVDPDNAVLSRERLALIDAVRIVLANGLHLLGVKAPLKM